MLSLKAFMTCRSKSYGCLAMRSAAFIKFLPAKAAQCRLQDKITILSCSPTTEERQQVEAFAEQCQLPVTYWTRQNFGIDQGARIEYFSGKIEDLREVLKTQYIFQFQDHYLDTAASYSKWGSELNCRIKGDVVPENVIFDLDSLHELLSRHKIAAAFCDRNNPCWFQRNGVTHIAPNGGNYILRTKQLEDKHVQTELAHMYRWAVYAEFKWGELFFHEVNTYYSPFAIQRAHTLNFWRVL